MPTGRPRNFDEDIVLERVMNSFWQHGFEDTTFEQLVIDSGLSRSSLYNSFGNKDALFDKAIERYIDQNFSSLRAKLEDAENGNDSVKRFVRGFDYKFKVGDKDCLLRKALLYNASSPEAPQQTGRLERYLRDLWAALVKAVSQSKQVGSSRLTNEERGAVLVAAMLGSAVLARNGRNDLLLKSVVRGSIKLIEQ